MKKKISIKAQYRFPSRQIVSVITSKTILGADQKKHKVKLCRLNTHSFTYAIVSKTFLIDDYVLEDTEILKGLKFAFSVWDSLPVPAFDYKEKLGKSKSRPKRLDLSKPCAMAIKEMLLVLKNTAGVKIRDLAAGMGVSRDAVYAWIHISHGINHESYTRLIEYVKAVMNDKSNPQLIDTLKRKHDEISKIKDSDFI